MYKVVKFIVFSLLICFGIEGKSAEEIVKKDSSNNFRSNHYIIEYTDAPKKGRRGTFLRSIDFYMPDTTKPNGAFIWTKIKDIINTQIQIITGPGRDYSSEGSSIFNNLSDTLKILNLFKKYYSKPSEFSLSISNYINPLTFSMEYSTWTCCGGHGNEEIRYLTYDNNTMTELSIPDIFKDTVLLRKRLHKSYFEQMGFNYFDVQNFPLDKEFAIHNNSLYMTFNPYTISGYMATTVEASLKGIRQNKNILRNKQKKIEKKKENDD